MYTNNTSNDERSEYGIHYNIINLCLEKKKS